MANANHTQEPPAPANASGQRNPSLLATKQRRIARQLWRKTTPRKPPAKIKAERFVTVSLYPEANPTTPFIRLRGLWLRQAGFNVQTRVRIQVKQGRLILTPESTSAAP